MKNDRTHTIYSARQYLGYARVRPIGGGHDLTGGPVLWRWRKFAVFTVRAMPSRLWRDWLAQPREARMHARG